MCWLSISWLFPYFFRIISILRIVFTRFVRIKEIQDLKCCANCAPMCNHLFLETPLLGRICARCAENIYIGYPGYVRSWISLYSGSQQSKIWDSWNPGYSGSQSCANCAPMCNHLYLETPLLGRICARCAEYIYRLSRICEILNIRIFRISTIEDMR